jgi:hypothetical protein
MFFPARRHNELAARAAGMYPIRVAEEQAPGRAHPWQIRPQWVELKTHPAGGYWTATVNPGLVNGQPAAITMPFSHTPPAVQERLKAEARAAKKPQPSGKQPVKVFLDEQASVELRWRAIGADAAPEGSATGNADTGEVRASFEPVPEFFRIRGVADANPDLLGPQAETERYLRACDIVLTQPRVALANEVTVGAVVDGSILSANPTFLVPEDEQPMVTAQAKFVAPLPPTLESFLSQRFADLPFDQVLLATVYALSPAFPDDTLVRGGWNIFVRYYTHWNLAHAGQRIRPRQELPRITFVTPLAAGLLNLQIGEILSQNNDFSQAMLDLFQQTKLGGIFYAV